MNVAAVDCSMTKPECHYWRDDAARWRFDLACAKDPEPRNTCQDCRKFRPITEVIACN